MRCRLLLALALSLFGCRARPHAERVFDPPSPPQRSPLDAALAINSNTPALELGEASAELRRTISAINGSLPIAVHADWQIIATVDNRKERLAWLAHDFRAPAFLRAEQLDEGRILEKAPTPLHVGVLTVLFADCHALDEAKAKVVKSGRQNFALPVLTMFKMRVRDRSLVFVFSETPMHKDVETLFREVGTILGPDRPCGK